MFATTNWKTIIVTVVEWNRKKQDWRRLTIDLATMELTATKREQEEYRQEEEWIVRRRRAKRAKGERKGAMVVESCTPRARHFKADRHVHTVTDWTGRKRRITYETYCKLQDAMGLPFSVNRKDRERMQERDGSYVYVHESIWTISDSWDDDNEGESKLDRPTMDRLQGVLAFDYREHTVSVRWDAHGKQYRFSVTLEGQPVLTDVSRETAQQWARETAGHSRRLMIDRRNAELAQRKRLVRCERMRKTIARTMPEQREPVDVTTLTTYRPVVVNGNDVQSPGWEWMQRARRQRLIA